MSNKSKKTKEVVLNPGYIRAGAITSKSLLARGNGKPLTAASQIVGQRAGKGLEAATYEVINEMSVDPPATPKEAEVFCRIQIKRCRMNLANAKDRGDKRAVIHLERKLAVYEYLYRLSKTEAPPARLAGINLETDVQGIKTDDCNPYPLAGRNLSISLTSDHPRSKKRSEEG